MEIVIIIVFVLGYLAIALEHPIKINKTASALVTAVVCWTLFAVSDAPETLLNSTRYTDFIHELGEKASSLSAADLSSLARSTTFEIARYFSNAMVRRPFRRPVYRAPAPHSNR